MDQGGVSQHAQQPQLSDRAHSVELLVEEPIDVLDGDTTPRRPVGRSHHLRANLHYEVHRRHTHADSLTLYVCAVRAREGAA